MRQRFTCLTLPLALLVLSFACSTSFVNAGGQETSPLVILDEGHSEWLVSGSVQFLIQNLEERDYLVQTLTSTITLSLLEDCDVLIIGTAWGSFTQTEIQAIEEFVKNGGGLLLTGVGWSWPEGDGTIEGVYDYPMNQIAQKFGGFFNPDIIYDPTDYTTEPASPIFHTPFIKSHPITVGVSKAAAGVWGGLGGFPSSLSLTTGVALITGDDDSYGGHHESPYPNPGMYPPFLGAIEYFLGRIVLVGHEGIFVDGAIQEHDNKILGVNIINWLSLPPPPPVPEFPFGTVLLTSLALCAYLLFRKKH